MNSKLTANGTNWKQLLHSSSTKKHGVLLQWLFFNSRFGEKNNCLKMYRILENLWYAIITKFLNTIHVAIYFKCLWSYDLHDQQQHLLFWSPTYPTYSPTNLIYGKSTPQHSKVLIVNKINYNNYFVTIY